MNGAAKPAKPAKPAKTPKRARATTKPTFLPPPDQADLLFGALREGLLKGEYIIFNYTIETGAIVGYKAKLGINASNKASQKVAGGGNKVMGRDWVHCHFAADQLFDWRHFTLDKLNSPAEGGWALCGSKKTKALLDRLRTDGLPNKAVEEHLKDTRKAATASKKATNKKRQK